MDENLCLPRIRRGIKTRTPVMSSTMAATNQQRDDDEDEQSPPSSYYGLHHHKRQIMQPQKQQQQQQQHERPVQETEEELQHDPLVNLVGDVGAILFAPLDLSRLKRSSTNTTSCSKTTTIGDFVKKPFFAKSGDAYTATKERSASSFWDTTRTLDGTACTVESSSWSLMSERTIQSSTRSTATNSTRTPPIHFYRDLNKSADIMTSHEETADKCDIEHEDEEEDEDNKKDEKPLHYPVELQWENSLDLLACPRILTSSMMQQLHDEGLPESLQLNKWERCFAIGRDGDCFLTLLDYCAPYTQTLVCIRTTRGHILGGFVSHPWCQQQGHGKRQSYYGSSGGLSFLFCSHPGQVDASISSGTSSIPSPDLNKELQIYKWTGCNDYCQICNVDQAKIAMGGHGDFGLIVEDNFGNGSTGHCSSFNNPPLIPNNYNDCDSADGNNNNNNSGSGSGDGFFEVEAFEIYGLVPYIQSFVPTPSCDDDNNRPDLFKKTITDSKGSRWIRTALHGS